MSNWVFEAGEELYLTKTDSATAVPGTEPAVIVLVSSHQPREGYTLCWVEWPNKPMRYQRNGAVLPREQLFIRNDA